MMIYKYNIPVNTPLLDGKERDYLNSYREVQSIKALDWMEACFEWIRKRDTAYTLNNADIGESK